MRLAFFRVCRRPLFGLLALSRPTVEPRRCPLTFTGAGLPGLPGLPRTPRAPGRLIARGWGAGGLFGEGSGSGAGAGGDSVGGDFALPPWPVPCGDKVGDTRVGDTCPPVGDADFVGAGVGDTRPPPWAAASLFFSSLVDRAEDTVRLPFARFEI